MLERFLPPFERTAPSEAPELMDRPDADPAALEDALTALSRTNRLFGGRRAVTGPLRRAVDGSAREDLRVLDVGTGAGDVAASFARDLRRLGRRPRFVLADLHGSTLRIARRRWAEVGGPAPARFVRLSGASLPFRDGCFELSFSATMLHHLERNEAVSFLREIARVSRRAWLVTDLRRSWPTCAAVRCLSATLWRRNPLPRRDGPLSVRRAFTPDEARSLLREAGLPEADAGPAGLFRIRLRGGALSG